MAQHAIQRPMRARLAIGTGLLAAGMLLVAPAATAFAAPPGCPGAVTFGSTCHHKDGGTTGTGVTATDTRPMSHHPCAKPADPAPDPSTS